VQLLKQEFHPRLDDPRRVLLFVDTFTDCYEPALGLGAVRVLGQLGCTVVPALPVGWKRGPRAWPIWPSGLRCCGRTLISNGLLSRAVKHARHNVRRLYPWVADSNRPIIACEPSCILTLRDDYPALLRGESRRQAEVVAAACLTFEEFLERECVSYPDSAALFQSLRGPRRILVQGHCHQRSLTGMESALRVLRRIPGAEVVDLDAGCCGMAGSFGYEKEHYEISRRVGEHQLFPALRQADAETAIVASGFSCRMQIQHFSGRTALHPAQLLDALFSPAASSVVQT
jgi:Fe-S oxidoreductase